MIIYWKFTIGCDDVINDLPWTKRGHELCRCIPPADPSQNFRYHDSIYLNQSSSSFTIYNKEEIFRGIKCRFGKGTVYSAKYLCQKISFHAILNGMAVEVGFNHPKVTVKPWIRMIWDLEIGLSIFIQNQSGLRESVRLLVRERSRTKTHWRDGRKK